MAIGIFMAIFGFLALVLGGMFFIGLYQPKETVKIQNSSDLNEDSLTIKELKSTMNKLCDEYHNQSIKLTSVQRANFETQFEKKYNIKTSCDTDYSYHFYIQYKPVIIDDIFEVEDVFEKESESIKCYKVRCSNDIANFVFSARLNSGADKLYKGEKIHIRGTVNVSSCFTKISSESLPCISYISIDETDHFKIKFNIV